MQKLKTQKNTHQKYSQKKLAAYSAMAVAFAGIQQDADAQVLYTDVNPDFLFTEETVSAPQFDYLYIDMNGDATNEFLVGFGSFTFDGTCYRAGSMSFYLINYASVMVSTTIGGDKDLRVLNAGANINSGANWDNYIIRSFVHSDFYMDNCDADIEYAGIVGPWNNKKQKYLGVRFLASGNYHYGWVRVTANVFADSGDAIIDTLQIDGFAFEQTPNTPITAGDGYSAIIENEIQFAMYPNPANTYIYLRTEHIYEGDLGYSILDIQGKNILKGNINSENATIQISNLSPGFYFIELSNKENERIGMKQFIKQ